LLVAVLVEIQSCIQVAVLVVCVAQLQRLVVVAV
jgi:hypothetical protein